MSPEPDDPKAQADRLVGAAVRLTRTLQALTTGGPLTAPQIGALIVITYAGRIIARNLAAQQQVTPATMSKLVAELEARGLVRRTPDANDARQLWIEATDEGARLIAEQHGRRLAPLVRVLDKLTPAERRRIDEASALIEALTLQSARI